MLGRAQTVLLRPPSRLGQTRKDAHLGNGRTDRRDDDDVIVVLRENLRFGGCGAGHAGEWEEGEIGEQAGWERYILSLGACM